MYKKVNKLACFRYIPCACQLKSTIWVSAKRRSSLMCETSVDGRYIRVWLKVRVEVKGVASCRPPPQWRLLLVCVKHRRPWLEGTDHLLNHFVEEDAGQLRVQERPELKWHLQKSQEGGQLLGRYWVYSVEFNWFKSDFVRVLNDKQCLEVKNRSPLTEPTAAFDCLTSFSFKVHW